MPAMVTDALLAEWAKRVARCLLDRHLTLATAESCTGGLVGAWLTSVAGSSEYYLGGLVCYANRAKTVLAGVDPAILEQFGAVSEPTARALAEGVRERLGSDAALSVTGIAGPGGGSPDKPVGLVYIGAAGPWPTVVERHVFVGNRQAVREQAVAAAFRLLCQLVTGDGPGLNHAGS